MTFTNPSSVLIVDDEAGIRTALRVSFTRNGWDVETASGVSEATRLLENKDFQLVVSDMRMPDGDGLEVMRSARKMSSSTAVILLTAFGNVPDAVQAMRSGAFDYLTKPVSFQQLEEAAARVMRAGAAAPRADHSESRSIVGRAPQLLRSLERARAAATTDADVLVEAESGTGKSCWHGLSTMRATEAVSRLSQSTARLFLSTCLRASSLDMRVELSPAPQPQSPGKFELANGGTLLLDEIGEMPLNLQPKLLRALQEREFERLGETRSVKVDIRVIATTNVNLSAMVDEGKFRSDLYYRLAVIPLTLPALRDRKGDVEVLAHYFVDKFAAKGRGPAQRLTLEFIERLNAHSWPGNVRELGNFMRRVCSLHPDVDLDGSCFDQEFQGRAKAAPIPATASMFNPGAPIRQLERAHLESTLAMTQGNRTQAAEMLGISIRTMRNRIREYGLPPRRYA